MNYLMIFKMTNKYLFVFTISSVQSFISQARKTQDLFAGSQILSDLIKAGISHFKETTYSSLQEFIFPNLEAQNPEASLPNRFIRQINIPDDITEHEVERFLKDIAEGVKKSVYDKLHQLANTSLKGREKPVGFDEQIQNTLDIHWSFQQIQEDKYSDAFLKLEKSLASAKNIREFSQHTYQDGVDYGEMGRKCSLDGENNALFYKTFIQENGKTRKPNYLNQAKPIERFALEAGEGLSAMSFIKRFYTKAQSFPSTAEIALMQDESQLSDEHKLILDCFKKLFHKKDLPQACLTLFSQNLISKIKLINYKDRPHWNEHFDYQYCFEENITRKNFPDSLQYDLVKLLQNKLQPHLKTKYYALILFDGDSMGKWLSGANLKPEYREGGLKEFHKHFSKLLADFGKHAREKILNQNKMNGATVYTGGDDFLGFVNLHHLFDIIQELRVDFDKHVNNRLSTYKAIDKHLTFSAGIVISHYKIPLSEVLKKARETEKKAKKLGERNAFAIAALKHSGEVQECVFKWDQQISDPAALSNWSDLNHVFTQLNNKTFSNKFIINLTTSLYDLAGLRLDTLGSVSNTAVFAETKRLLKRALIDNDQKEEIEKLSNTLERLFKASKKIEKIRSVENFIHALHIVDFIQRKI